jgi:hypothetical protein
LDGPLPNLCPVIPTSNQDGRQAKNRKRGEEMKKKIISSEATEPISTKLLWNDPWMALYKIVSGDPDFQPRRLPS